MQTTILKNTINLSFLLGLCCFWGLSSNLSAQVEEHYLFNTNWTLSEYEIIDVNEVYEGKAFEERIQEFLPDFIERKTHFEFGEQNNFTFEIEEKQTLNGLWQIEDQVFNIYSNQSHCDKCNVDFDFQLETLEEDSFVISFSQDERDTVFRFKLHFIKN